MTNVLTDRDVLDRLAPLLVRAYEHGGWAIPPRDAPDVPTLPPDLVRGIRDLMARARELGLTHRQIASLARVPGEQVMRWIDDPRERAQAHAAEIHHHDRAAAMARLRRAREVDGLHRGSGGRPGMTKVALAELYSVSRPTIDAWLADAEADAIRSPWDPPSDLVEPLEETGGG